MSRVHLLRKCCLELDLPHLPNPEEELVQERTVGIGLLIDSRKQSSTAETGSSSQVRECALHEANHPGDKVRDAIVEIVQIADRLFTVEELKAIRGLIENRLSEIPQQHFEKSLQFAELVRT